MKAFHVKTRSLEVDILAKTEMEARRFVHMRTLEEPESLHEIPKNYYIECMESGAKVYVRQWIYIARSMGIFLHIINIEKREKVND